MNKIEEDKNMLDEKARHMIECIKSQIINLSDDKSEIVYDFLTTCYQVWLMEIEEECDWDEMDDLTDAFVDFVNEEFSSGCEGYLGNDVEESDPNIGIRKVCVHELDQSLDLFRMFPHTVQDSNNSKSC
jgi:hypothetical protein